MTKGGIEFENLKGFVDDLHAYGKKLVDAIAGAIYLEANNIMNDAVENCPIDKGTLRRSGYVTEPQKIWLGEPVVEIGFGGPAEQYAEVVHENMSARHEIGGPKYLERALDKARATWENNVGAIARDFIESGTSASRTDRPTDPWQGGEKK